MGPRRLGGRARRDPRRPLRVDDLRATLARMACLGGDDPRRQRRTGPLGRLPIGGGPSDSDPAPGWVAAAPPRPVPGPIAPGGTGRLGRGRTRGRRRVDAVVGRHFGSRLPASSPWRGASTRGRTSARFPHARSAWGRGGVGERSCICRAVCRSGCVSPIAPTPSSRRGRAGTSSRPSCTCGGRPGASPGSAPTPSTSTARGSAAGHPSTDGPGRIRGLRCVARRRLRSPQASRRRRSSSGFGSGRRVGMPCLRRRGPCAGGSARGGGSPVVRPDPEARPPGVGRPQAGASPGRGLVTSPCSTYQRTVCAIHSATGVYASPSSRVAREPS